MHSLNVRRFVFTMRFAHLLQAKVLLVMLLVSVRTMIVGGATSSRNRIKNRQFIASPALSPFMNILRHPPNHRPLNEHGRRRKVPIKPNRSCNFFTKDICLSDPNYPQDKVQHSLDVNSRLVSMMYAEGIIDSRGLVDGVDPIQELAYTYKHYYGANRRSDVGNEVHRDYSKEGGFICPSEVKYAKPQRARNQKGVWKTVVNTNKMPQTVRLERCRKPEKSCSYISKHFISQCSQVYTLQRLMVFDENNGLHIDVFRIPSCCSCHIKGYAMKFPNKEPKASSSDSIKSTITFEDAYFEDDDSAFLEGDSFEEVALANQATKTTVNNVKYTAVPEPKVPKSPNLWTRVTDQSSKKNKNRKRPSGGSFVGYTSQSGSQRFRPRRQGPSSVKKKQPANQHRIQRPKGHVNNNNNNKAQLMKRPQRTTRRKKPTRNYGGRNRRQRIRRPNRNRYNNYNNNRNGRPSTNRVNRKQSQMEEMLSSDEFRRALHSRVSLYDQNRHDLKQKDAEKDVDLQPSSSNILFSPTYNDHLTPNNGDKRTTSVPTMEVGFGDEFKPLTFPTTAPKVELVKPDELSSGSGGANAGDIKRDPQKSISPIPFITPDVSPENSNYYNYNYHPIIDYMLNNKPS